MTDPNSCRISRIKTDEPCIGIIVRGPGFSRKVRAAHFLHKRCRSGYGHPSEHGYHEISRLGAHHSRHVRAIRLRDQASGLRFRGNTHLPLSLFLLQFHRLWSRNTDATLNVPSYTFGNIQRRHGIVLKHISRPVGDLQDQDRCNSHPQVGEHGKCGCHFQRSSFRSAQR